MNYIKGILLTYFLLTSTLMAETLAVKVDQNTIDLSFWPAVKAHYGAVLIAHGSQKGERSQLLTDFAQQLAQNGWSVALLNYNKKSIVPWNKLVPEAISTLRMKKNKRIIMVHYGDRLNQTLDYFNQPQAKMINGLVMISAYDLQTDLEKPVQLRFPVFDVAGQFDYDTVLSQMSRRATQFKEHNYKAIAMPGAHHDYEYSQKLLVAFIHGWMAKLPVSEPQRPPILTSYLEPVHSVSSVVAKVTELDFKDFIDDPAEP